MEEPVDMPSQEQKVVVCKDIDALARKAATTFVETAGKSIRERGVFTVALSGGGTPVRLYGQLAREEYIKRIDWRSVNFFWGDERAVGPDDPESNFLTGRVNLLDIIKPPQKNVHRIKGELGEEAAEEYSEELCRAFGLKEGKLPVFDLILLGMGADGHTASLFPGSTALKEDKKLVTAVYMEKLKTTRITLTPAVINNARKIVFLVSGRDKRDTLKRVLEGEFMPEELPAQITRNSRGEVLWLVDKEAAGMLKGGFSGGNFL